VLTIVHYKATTYEKITLISISLHIDVNLLALLGQNKDNINVIKSSLYINFDQIMMGIYSNSSITRDKINFILLTMIL